MAVYIPKQGDIVFLDFDPQSGHEQKGRRPALVISIDYFNKSRGMTIVCPVTNQEKKYPSVIKLPDNIKTTGYILCDQLKSLDCKERSVQFVENLSADALEEILDIVMSFVGR